MMDRLEELIELQREQCQALVQGECTSRRCMNRGGYNGGAVDYSIATCLEKETTEALQELRAARAEIERLKDAADNLGKAIHEQAVALGIGNEDSPLTGPQLLMLSSDATEQALKNKASLEPAEAVVEAAHDILSYANYVKRNKRVSAEETKLWGTLAGALLNHKEVKYPTDLQGKAYDKQKEQS